MICHSVVESQSADQETRAGVMAMGLGPGVAKPRINLFDQLEKYVNKLSKAAGWKVQTHMPVTWYGSYAWYG